MQPESVIVYERVLKGERWPQKYVGTATSSERTREILRYVFFQKLGITDFESAKQVLNREFVKKHRLFAVIRMIEKPPELLPNEYDHVLWQIFPERKVGQKTLVTKVYSEVLSGKRKTFPRGYFTDARYGKKRAEICVKHLCRKILHYSTEKIAREFSHSNGIKILAKYKLKILLSSTYFSLSDMMYEVYPNLIPRLVYYQQEQDGRRAKNKNIKEEVK